MAAAGAVAANAPRVTADDSAPAGGAAAGEGAAFAGEARYFPTDP